MTGTGTRQLTTGEAARALEGVRQRLRVVKAAHADDLLPGTRLQMDALLDAYLDAKARETGETQEGP